MDGNSGFIVVVDYLLSVRLAVGGCLGRRWRPWPGDEQDPIDGRLCPPMNPPTATAKALRGLSPSVMCIRTSSVLLMTLGEKLTSWRRTHSAHGETRNGERRSEGW